MNETFTLKWNIPFEDSGVWKLNGAVMFILAHVWENIVELTIVIFVLL